MDIVEKLRRQADADDKAGTLYAHEIGREAATEIEHLRERCHPSKVVMIGNTGHYVSEAVAAEIERLRRPGYVLVPIEPTTDMLYAMAECDGYRRGDRDHPMLTRWEDYWRMALSVLTPNDRGHRGGAA